MRQQHIKPSSRQVGLHNYLKSDFTFYWDKEPYTIPAGETYNMFEWLAVHGAVKMAEAWFNTNPTNAKSSDPKVRGFYSRHDDDFKKKVKEAIIYPKNSPMQEISETASAVAAMNEDDDAPKKKSSAIELPEFEDEIVPGCAECHATGPRHKPTCSKFVKHEKDASQAAKLGKAGS